MERYVGRPPLGLKTILVRLSPDVMTRIRRITTNVSAFVREAVEAHLKKAEKKTKKTKKPKD